MQESQTIIAFISTGLQKMKDWHLVLMALGVTAIGIVLLVIRSGLQVSPPQLVRDNENREGRTVRLRAYSLDVFVDSRGHMFCLLATAESQNSM